MRARPIQLGPTKLTVFYVLALVLGFIVGVLLAMRGYTVPVAVSTFATLALVQLSEERRQRVALRVRKAIKRCGLDFGEAAQTMGLTAPDLCRMLTGERKLDVWRLEMLPREFQREYNVLALTDSGLPERFAKFLQIAPALPFIQTEKRSA